MDARSAVISFSQSEKIKAGLIWASQTIEMNSGIPEHDKTGSQQIIGALVSMVASEVQVAMKMAPDEKWAEALKHINKALIMIHSNVVQEATFHLSRALSQITSVGQASMTRLLEEKIL
ncbi:MAG: hypothetical protein JRI93_01740 [Deltaproteobacteria bacterium]|nr:hypothetical protein [Deltaproteobacteria bacterium]MBW2611837.1 hypothetical protein [Deltaproteobacteria bacterium]MBW2678196.1 hypothetical protein [Deltaproteobacteria bacterium]